MAQSRLPVSHWSISYTPVYGLGRTFCGVVHVGREADQRLLLHRQPCALLAGPHHHLATPLAGARYLRDAVKLVLLRRLLAR